MEATIQQTITEIKLSSGVEYTDGQNFNGSDVADDVDQLVDLDAHNFESLIDECHRRMKHDIMGYMHGLKSCLQAKQKAAAERERLNAAELLQAKQGEIDLLKKELQDAMQQSTTSSAISLRVAGALGTANGNLKAVKLATQCWYLWRSWAARRIQIRKNMQKALRWYFSTYMLGRTFQAWRKYAQTEHRHTLHRKHQQNLEAMQAEVHAQYEETIAGLKQQLTNAQEALYREAQQREQLEEDMKQAFMRGVCALNIEAMQVMKRGMPPQGSNPYYASTPNVTPSVGATSKPGDLTAEPTSTPQNPPTTYNVEATVEATITTGAQPPPQLPQQEAQQLLQRIPASVVSTWMPPNASPSRMSTPTAPATPQAATSAAAAAAALPAAQPPPAAQQSSKIWVQRGPAADGPRPRPMPPVVAARKPAH